MIFSPIIYKFIIGDVCGEFLHYFNGLLNGRPRVDQYSSTTSWPSLKAGFITL